MSHKSLYKSHDWENLMLVRESISKHKISILTDQNKENYFGA